MTHSNAQRGAACRRMGWVVAVTVLVLDQLSKWWIVAGVMSPPHRIEVTPFFNIVLVWNRGVTFGMLNDPGTSRWALIGISLAVVVALALWLAKVAHKPLAAALGAIIGGALGNVIDRLYHGAVVDFLDFHLAGAHWPAFNLADAGIVIGAGLMLWDAFFPPKT